jgi:hypothetical protein
MTEATGSSELVERLREASERDRSLGLLDLLEILGSRLQEAADRIADLEARLARAEEALKEAKIANETIRLNRDGQGSGRVKVATAMHRIEQLLRAALKEQDNG